MKKIYGRIEPLQLKYIDEIAIRLANSGFEIVKQEYENDDLTPDFYIIGQDGDLKGYFDKLKNL